MREQRSDLTGRQFKSTALLYITLPSSSVPVSCDTTLPKFMANPRKKYALLVSQRHSTSQLHFSIRHEATCILGCCHLERHSTLSTCCLAFDGRTFIHL